MIFQICLNLFCVWIGFMIAIYLNKYLSSRKEKSIPGYKLYKELESKRNGTEWFSEIPTWSLDMGNSPIVSVDKNFTLNAKIGKENGQKI